MGQTILTESLGAIEAEIAAGQVERALARCQELQTHYPRALAVQRVLGEAWLALRKPREALGALDRTLAGNPEDVRACCARAIVHQMHGDAAAALSWYRRACDVRPDDQALRATYREMASQIGQPAYRPSRVGLARLFLRGGLFTHAIREWELLLAEHADLLEAQVGLVETLWRAGRSAQADEWARRTLVNAPSCEKPLLISAVIAHDAGQDDEAERLLQRVSLLDPDQRMAQALFADRLAAGDRALSVLLWGPDAPEPQPPYSPPPPQSPATPQRPGATGGPAPAPSAPSSYVGGQSAPSGFGRSPQPTATGAASQASSSASAQSAPRASRTSGPVSSGPINDRLIRPLVDSRPAPTPSRPLGAPLALASDLGAGSGGQPGLAATSAPMTTTRTQPLPPPPPRASALPSTFGNIFKETEGMIWGVEDADSMDQPDALTDSLDLSGFDAIDGAGLARPAQDTTTGAPATGELAPSDAFARSTQFVPPMIAEHSAVMDDTEARQAINWVHWLQAQGARTIPSDMAPGATGPLNGATSPLAPRSPAPQSTAPAPAQPQARPAAQVSTRASEPAPPQAWPSARPSQPLRPAQPQPPSSAQGPAPAARPQLGVAPQGWSPPQQSVPQAGAQAIPQRPSQSTPLPPSQQQRIGAQPTQAQAQPPSAPGVGATRPSPAMSAPWALTGRPATAQPTPTAPAPSSGPPLPAEPGAPPSATPAPMSSPLMAQGIVVPPELASRRTGPLPPPSPEALRSMFAQLEPVSHSQERADANEASAVGAPLSAPLAAGPTPNPPNTGASGQAQRSAEEARANSAPWPALSAWSTETDAPEDDVAAPATGDEAPLAPSAETPTDAPSVMTLEALERGFAASGFEQFTAQPGALAALAAETAHAAPTTHTTGRPETPTTPRIPKVDASAAVAPTSEATATTEPTPTDSVANDSAETDDAGDAVDEAELTAMAAPVPSGPDPKDYAARLELARRKRNEGALDDAFVEYTAVLRNAPDLLPEVMRDLEDLSAEESAHPEAHRLLGDARIRQGDYMSALASLNRATALSQAQDQEDE